MALNVMILMSQIFDVTANENARYKRNELELLFILILIQANYKISTLLIQIFAKSITGNGTLSVCFIRQVDVDLILSILINILTNF